MLSRSASTAGSARGGVSTNGGRRVHITAAADFKFQLPQTKAQVFKDMQESFPPSFRKFYNSELYDNFLQHCILYFVCRFQYDCLSKALEKARRQHLEGYSPLMGTCRLTELEEEAETHYKELPPLYVQMIMKFSTYKHLNNDRNFFESLYNTLIAILDQAFEPLRQRALIEMELGFILRTRHFNLYKRANEPPRSVDTLSVTELFAIKNESSNRALNSKLIASVYEKPATLQVQAASVNNSPLISGFISSPVVARALTKDPELRAEMVNATTGSGLGAHPSDSPLRREVRKAMAQRAADTSAERSIQQQLRTPKLTQQIMTQSTAVKGPAVSVESDGLLSDEHLQQLDKLKTYISTGEHPGDRANALRRFASRSGSQSISASPSIASATGGEPRGSRRTSHAGSTALERKDDEAPSEP